jgi:hypothetical protein
MISREKADACLEAAAADLKSLSYEELERLAELHGSANEWETRELQVDGQTVYISTTFAKFGRFRKRVSVEMVLGVEGQEKQCHYPFIYFERFASGRLYPSSAAKGWQPSGSKVLLYVLFGAVAIALLVVLWHLYLRDG